MLGPMRRVAQVVGTPGFDQLDEVVLNTMNMAEYGFDVAVLVPPPQGRRFHPYRALRSGAVQYAPNLGSLNPNAGSFSGFLWLSQWFRSVAPDLIHVHGRAVGPVAVAAARAAGIPSVLTLHSSRHQPWSRPARYLAQQADLLIGTAAATGAKGDPAVGLNRWRTLRPGFEFPDRLGWADERRRLRRWLGYDEVTVVVAPTARHGRDDLETAARAFLAVDRPGTVLVLAGEAGRHLRLYDLHRRLGAPPTVVVETGSDPSAVVAIADLVVSSDSREGADEFSIRAAGHGAAVVVPDIGQVSDLLAVVRGERYRLGDIDSLTAAVDRALNQLDQPGDPDKQMDEVQERYSADRLRAETAGLWRELVVRRQPGVGRSEGAPRTMVRS